MGVGKQRLPAIDITSNQSLLIADITIDQLNNTASPPDEIDVLGYTGVGLYDLLAAIALKNSQPFLQQIEDLIGQDPENFILLQELPHRHTLPHRVVQLQGSFLLADQTRQHLILAQFKLSALVIRINNI